MLDFVIFDERKSCPWGLRTPPLLELANSLFWVAYSILAKFWFLAPKAPFELKDSGIDAEFCEESENRVQRAPTVKKCKIF